MVGLSLNTFIIILNANGLINMPINRMTRVDWKKSCGSQESHFKYDMGRLKVKGQEKISCKHWSKESKSGSINTDKVDSE